MPIRFTRPIGSSVGFRITACGDQSVMDRTTPVLNRCRRDPRPLAHTLKFGFFIREVTY
jgi:hypothetical protein